MTVVALALAVLLALPSAAAAVATPTRTATTTKKPAPTTTTAPVVWQPLPAFDTTVNWLDCGDGWQCGTLTVPVDWTKPTADVVPLSLIRRPADLPGDRVGALVINPGGPGTGGTSHLRASLRRMPDVVKQRFDLVSWDPRGTGDSRPIDCVDDGFLNLSLGIPPVPDSSETLATARRINQAFARGCNERSGAYARQVGTRNTARDLEAIRIALGEPTLNYLGFSYGTILGIAYAQMFPGNIRTMVLDGPPDYWLPPLDYAYQQAAGFKHALDAFLDWCEADGSCALRDAGAPREAFDALLARVDAGPVPGSYTTASGETSDGGLTASLFATAVLSMLYDQSRGWPTLGRALRAVAVDDDSGPLLSLADSYLHRAPDGTWDPLVEANAVISCIDRPDPKPRPAARELADVAQFQSQLPPWGGSWAVSTCAGMPKPARGDRLGDVRVTGAPPIVVIGTTGDPATPYAGAPAMVSRIAGSTLLTFDSTEHTAYGTQRSSCIDDLVNAYFVDGTTPPPGTTCSAGV